MSDESKRVFHEVIAHATEVLFGLSILGAFCTILTFTVFSRIRTYPIKLIIYLCVTIVIGHLVFSTSRHFAPINWLCVYIASIVHYFLLSNFVWCACIAFNFFQMIVKRNPNTRKLEKYYHFVGWGLPCIPVVIVAANQSYGLTAPINGSCYIRNSQLSLAAFFIPGFILVCVNAVLFFFVASEIHFTLSNAPETERKENSKEIRVLLSIFVTIGLSWLFAFVYALVSRVEVVGDITLVLMTIFTPLQGFFIFIAYCMNKKVRHKWQNLLSRCFPFLAPSVESKTGGTGTTSTRGGGYSSSASGRSTTSSSSGRSYAEVSSMNSSTMSRR
eukprot:TRINITY_DN7815_c0_g1_i1.p1 TRINITY_DN7815_c0_g1~~TRINITY_DN7815_c0_g1_i1.p1  ORF type:complete len:341 (-),score=61.22 TRINITY_DN7815_c0_g1_i1:14-1003(-)